MKNLIKGAVAGLAASVLLVGGAEAQLAQITYNSNPQLCALSEAVGAAACSGWWFGNNSNQHDDVTDEIVGQGWLSGPLTELKTEEGSGDGPFQNWGNGVTVGSLTFDNPIWGDFVIALKAGNAFSLYYFQNAQGLSSIDFDMSAAPKVGNSADMKKANYGSGLSHASLYGGEFRQVPEPGTWFLLGTGLLGLAFVSGRRRQDVLA